MGGNTWGRLPRALGLVQVALLFFAVWMVGAAAFQFAERTPAAAGLGVVFLSLAAGSVLVFLRIYSRKRRWWFAALALPPVMSALYVWDAFSYGDGRFPIAALLWPGLVLACLLLPSVRAFYAPADHHHAPDQPTEPLRS